MIEKLRKTPSTQLLKAVGAIYVMGVIFSLMFGVQEVARLSYAVLFLTILLVMAYTVRRLTKGQVVVMIVIGVSGLFAEIIGVSTGIIFGEYEYITGLGPKFFNVPLLLAAMWVLVSWYGLAVFEATKKQFGKYALLIAAWAVVMYDVFLEPFATASNLWVWADGYVPFINYATWFVLALIFVSLLVKSKVHQVNGSFVAGIALIQILYFCVISIIFAVQY